MPARPPSPLFRMARYEPPALFAFECPPPAVRRISPSPLARSPPYTQPHEDDDTETDDAPTDEELFDSFYGKSLWSTFKNDKTILAPHLSSSPELNIPKAQVTVSLIFDRDEDGHQGGGDGEYEINVEVVSSSQVEGHGWTSVTYSLPLLDPWHGDKAAMTDLRYGLPKIHSCLQKYGFSIRHRRSEPGHERTEFLVIHSGPASHYHSGAPLLPLCFSALARPPTDTKFQVGTEYSDHLLARQREVLESKWRPVRAPIAASASHSETSGAMTLRQRCAMLDAKTLEYRQNVPRFKRKMEELNNERTANDGMPMQDNPAPAPLITQQA